MVHVFRFGRVFLPDGEGVVCLGGGVCWVPEAVAFA